MLFGIAAGSPAAAQGLLREIAPMVQSAAARSDATRTARPGAQRVDSVEAELVADRAAVAPGGTLRVGLRLKHDPSWHTYWRNPGDSGLPTQLALSLPTGWQAGDIEWPAPERIAVPPLASYGFSGEIVLPVAVRVPSDARADQAQITATAQWLVCKDVCVPGEAALSLAVPILRAGEPAASRWAPLFDAMATRTPRGAPVDATLHADARGWSIVFASSAASAEFFPYEAGLVKPAADQTLYAVGQERRRLALQRPDEGGPASPEAASAPASIEGVLVADGRAFELRARRDTAAAPTGERIAVATAQAQSPAAASTAPGSASTGSLIAAIGSGLLGGLLLNLMPCVFPVIGLKLIGFAQDGARNAAQMRRHAWAFAAGILAAFAVLAVLLLALRAAGEAVGWGFQLQSPGFVAAMVLLFVAIGLNFSGVYDIGAGLTRLAPMPSAPTSVTVQTEGRRLAGAFGSGLLATLVATPCTAPFMGSAVGFTLDRPAATVVAVLSAVGIGMAAPYVALAHAPGLARRLPRPGRWMESFKQFLAFPMYATAAWLAWVLGQQAGLDAVLRIGLAAVLLALAAWTWGRFWQRGGGRAPAAAALVAGVSAGLAGWLAWPADDAQADARSLPATASAARGWEPYSDVRLQALRAQGRTVFVDFTAAWCISCQANKKLVLDGRAVQQAFERRDVVMMRADWTRRDPEITRALAAFGRNGVPLYLVYRPGMQQAAVLPELLTSELVLRAVEG